MFYALDQVGPSHAFNVSVPLHLTSAVSEDALRAAFVLASARHDQLRTFFLQSDDKVCGVSMVSTVHARCGKFQSSGQGITWKGEPGVTTD